MKRYLKDVLNGLPALLKYLMVLGTVVLISFLFPEDLRFKYQFKQDTIWKYEAYQAPFDFAIEKQADEIQKDKKRIVESFLPIYELDLDLDKAVLEQVLLKTPQEDKQEIAALLREGYLQGVWQPQDSFTSEKVELLMGEEISLRKRTSLLPLDELVKRMAGTELSMLNWEQLLKPNVQYQNALTKRKLEGAMDAIPLSKGKVSEGEMIVGKGQIIDDNTYAKLSTVKNIYEQNQSMGSKYWNVWIGYLIITALCIAIFILYLIRNSYEIFSNFAQFTFVLLWILIFSYLVFFVEQLGVVSVYILPFCIVPIVIKNFFGEKIALITFLFVVLISSFLSTYGYEFTIIQILAGVVAVISDFNSRNWMSFFKSLGFIAIAYIISFFTLDLIEKGDIALLDWSGGAWLIGSAFLNLLAYPFIPLFERIFGFTSDVRLIELSDLENPLLRELALKAPGTFQHSLQVANLGEAAAKEVGANSTLVRTAALYHDIGKLTDPKYFVENAEGHNYHENLTPLESAKKIIAHVTDGISMAKKAGLPSIIVDFIRTHHGTTRVEYFYHKAKEQQTDADLNVSDFTYPGPNPRTKEETILMIADSLEAASKSLKDPNWEDLKSLLDKIIDGKISKGQFMDSSLNFSELERIKNSFLHTLKSIYHGRIKYPKDSSN